MPPPIYGHAPPPPPPRLWKGQVVPHRSRAAHLDDLQLIAKSCLVRRMSGGARGAVLAFMLAAGPAFQTSRLKNTANPLLKPMKLQRQTWFDHPFELTLSRMYERTLIPNWRLSSQSSPRSPRYGLRKASVPPCPERDWKDCRKNRALADARHSRDIIPPPDIPSMDPMGRDGEVRA